MTHAHDEDPNAQIEALKPCPCCSSDEPFSKQWEGENGGAFWFVKCRACGMSTDIHCGSEAHAITAWNRRAASIREAAAPSEEPVAAAVNEALDLLTAHELYRYRPKAFDGFIEYIKAHFALASPAVAPVAVSVKGLKWTKHAPGHWTAKSQVGRYEITVFDRLFLDGHEIGWHPTVDPHRTAAKAAAQADFNARILSSIIPDGLKAENCQHDWKIWPETDGQEQKCMKCGAYRKTPFFDRIETKLAADAKATEPLLSWEAAVDGLIRSIAEWADRTSPADYPDHLLVTPAELKQFARDVYALPAQDTDGVAKRVVAWLIERKDASLFQRPHWYHENPDGWHSWRPIAAEAKRFASKAEAEAYPAYQMIASDPTISITEHVFLGANP